MLPLAVRHPTAQVARSAEIGDRVTIGANVVIHDNVRIGDLSYVGSNVILGEPLAAYYRDPGYQNPPLSIGARAVLRSGTVVYAGATIGSDLETGHGTVVREESLIGNHCRLGTHSDIQGHSRLGDYVRLHSGVFIAQFSEIGNFVWIFPHALLANDPHPPSVVQTGPFIDEFAVVGAQAVVMPGVRIGRDAVVGAGAVVRHDVAPGELVAGVPARSLGPADRVRSRADGSQPYPWRYSFSRGMPWDGRTYDAWASTPDAELGEGESE